MTKLKVAILEDDPILLKDLKDSLEETMLCEVVIWASSYAEFLDKLKDVSVDAVALDIELGGGISGIQIAYKIRLPVLFVSSHNANNIKEIENLKREFELIVDHITKPFPADYFQKTAKRFLREVAEEKEKKVVYLDFEKVKGNKIPVDSIVYLCSDKENGAKSNNKMIFFTDKTQQELVDFSFSSMHKIGFDENKFITIHRAYRVNESKIERYISETHQIEVKVYKSPGKTKLELLPVSENYQKDVRKFRK